MSGLLAHDGPLARFEAAAHDTPLWLRSVHAALPFASQLVIHGSIRDLHPVPSSGAPLTFCDTARALWEVLGANGFDALVMFSPLDGLTIPFRRDGWEPGPRVEEGLGLRGRDRGARRPAATADFCGLDTAVDYVMGGGEPRLAIAVDYVSQCAGPEVDTTSCLGRAMLTALRGVHRSRPFHHEQRRQSLRHPVIWLADHPNDLPTWMLTGDGIRQIPVGPPDLALRARVADVLVGASFSGKSAGRFADATEGLSVRGMIDAAGFLRAAHDENPDVDDVDAAVRAYRVGVTENPWRNQQLRDRLADGVGLLERRVVGQRQAVQRVLDLLVRSAMGLTAAHRARPDSGVRGVLYFAGPTGVGKTEMAKAIAELVFGKEEALIRFDMSEFAQEGSELRLIGSPPGYVGHSAGGELTNAVRRRPFSVLLFDEIDKAHGRILDKFLQILSDGRLTDGSGDTVFFTDTIIVFTSNQGVLDTEGIDTASAEGIAEYQERIRGAVEEFITRSLNRPELLGRIGDNIIAFRPITPSFGRTIAERNIDTIERRVTAATGHALTIAPAVRERLIEAATRDLSKGGRGIGLALESAFVNPLARELFRVPPGLPVEVTGLAADDDGPRVVIEA